MSVRLEYFKAALITWFACALDSRVEKGPCGAGGGGAGRVAREPQTRGACWRVGDARSMCRANPNALGRAVRTSLGLGGRKVPFYFIFFLAGARNEILS